MGSVRLRSLYREGRQPIAELLPFKAATKQDTPMVAAGHGNVCMLGYANLPPSDPRELDSRSLK